MTRSELYDAVWAEPMTKVAPRIPMSDRGLAKACARYDIPVPPRGYWRQLQTGAAPPRTPLPPMDGDQEIEAQSADEVFAKAAEKRKPIRSLSDVIAPRTKQGASTGVDEASAKAPALPSTTPAAAATASPGPAEKQRGRSAAVAPPSAAPPDSEVDHVMSSALERHLQRATAAFLARVEAHASSLDESTQRTVLAWVAEVGAELPIDDPATQAIEALRARGSVRPRNSR